MSIEAFIFKENKNMCCKKYKNGPFWIINIIYEFITRLLE